MSRDERPSRFETASGLGVARESEWNVTVDDAETFRCGCSMLARIRLRPRNPSAFATMRCSLGFALHNEGEVAKCLAVEGPGECWKVTPDWRIPPPEPRHKRAARAAQMNPNGAAHVESDDEIERVDDTSIVVSQVIVEQAIEVIEVIEVVAAPTARKDGSGGVES